MYKIFDFYFRYDDFVESLASAEEVEAMAFCSSFVPHVLSDEKLGNFFKKVVELIHSGLLDPTKTSIDDQKRIILNALLRVITLKIKKKNYFLLESQNMETIVGQFENHVHYLSPEQKLILGKVCLFNNTFSFKI